MLLFADPVTGYTTFNDLTNQGWLLDEAITVAIEDGQGRNGLQALHVTDCSGGSFYRSLNSSVQPYYFATVHFSVKIDSHMDSSKIMRLEQGDGNTPMVFLGILGTNQLRVYDRNGSTCLTTSALSLDTWHCVALQVETAAEFGTVNLWVDAVSPLTPPTYTASNCDFRGDESPGPTNGVRFYLEQLLASPPAYHLSELFVYNDDPSHGPALATYLGDKRQYLCTANGAGDPLSPPAYQPAFTASPVVANYLNVDDPQNAVSDEDTTYVTTTLTGSGAMDLYEYTDLPAGVTGILAVVPQIELRLDTPAQLTNVFAVLAKSPTQDSRTNTTLSWIQMYDYYMVFQYVFPLDPEGLAWTEAVVNVTQGGPLLEIPY